MSYVPHVGGCDGLHGASVIREGVPAVGGEFGDAKACGGGLAFTHAGGQAERLFEVALAVSDQQCWQARRSRATAIRLLRVRGKVVDPPGKVGNGLLQFPHCCRGSLILCQFVSERDFRGRHDGPDEDRVGAHRAIVAQGDQVGPVEVMGLPEDAEEVVPQVCGEPQVLRGRGPFPEPVQKVPQGGDVGVVIGRRLVVAGQQMDTVTDAADQTGGVTASFGLAVYVVERGEPQKEIGAQEHAVPVRRGQHTSHPVGRDVAEGLRLAG